MAMQAIETLYTTFLLTRHLAVIAHERQKDFADQVELHWRRIEKQGFPLEFLFHEWREMWRHLGPGAYPLGPIGGYAQIEGFALISAPELAYYLSHTGAYVSDADELMIRKVEMASPGGFSLEGLGEAIEQVRELVKDLCYRNRQERERGDLELLERHVALVAKNSLPPPQVHIIAILLADDAGTLKKLIEDGKLALPGEELKKPQKPKSTQPRKPRKRPQSGDSNG
jgi:hypothetical protein